jgi:N-acyl-L-homoserine lactone synthetase
MERARKRIMVGLFEFFVRSGYEKVVMLSPVDLVFRYLLIGIDIKPLGLPVEIDGIKQVALIATIDQAALDALRAAYGVTEPQVIYIGAPDGDPLVLAPIDVQRLPLEAAE